MDQAQGRRNNIEQILTNKIVVKIFGIALSSAVLYGSNIQDVDEELLSD